MRPSLVMRPRVRRVAYKAFPKPPLKLVVLCRGCYRLRTFGRGCAQRASAVELFVPETRAEAARFADARAQPVNHGRDRIVLNAANQKNHQRRFAGRVRARSDADSLHARLAHPFLCVRSMDDQA